MCVNKFEGGRPQKPRHGLNQAPAFFFKGGYMSDWKYPIHRRVVFEELYENCKYDSRESYEAQPLGGDLTLTEIISFRASHGDLTAINIICYLKEKGIDLEKKIPFPW